MAETDLRVAFLQTDEKILNGHHGLHRRALYRTLLERCQNSDGIWRRWWRERDIEERRRQDRKLGHAVKGDEGTAGLQLRICIRHKIQDGIPSVRAFGHCLSEEGARGLLRFRTSRKSVSAKGRGRLCM
jgi:hypothetical protein